MSLLGKTELEQAARILNTLFNEAAIFKAKMRGEKKLLLLSGFP